MAGCDDATVKYVAVTYNKHCLLGYNPCKPESPFAVQSDIATP